MDAIKVIPRHFYMSGLDESPFRRPSSEGTTIGKESFNGDKI
jgi:hypothetical protein